MTQTFKRLPSTDQEGGRISPAPESTVFLRLLTAGWTQAREFWRNSTIPHWCEGIEVRVDQILHHYPPPPGY